MQEQAIAAHCQPTGCSQELTGAPSVLQEGPKASPPSSLLPASASPSQEEHGSQKNRHRIDGSLLLGVKREQRKNRTAGPTRREGDHKVSFYQRTGTFPPWAA